MVSLIHGRYQVIHQEAVCAGVDDFAADLAIDGAGDIAECWRPCPAGAYRAGGLKKNPFFFGAIDGAGDIAECWRPCPAGAYRAGGLKKIHFFSGQLDRQTRRRSHPLQLVAEHHILCTI